MGLDSTETVYDWENGDRIPADPDTIVTALPNATSVETAVFQFGKHQARVEAEIFAVTELTVADATTLTVELLWDTDRAGAFADSRVIEAYAPSGGTDVVVAGGRVALVSPESDVELFCKIKYTASADLSSNDVSLQLFPIG